MTSAVTMLKSGSVNQGELISYARAQLNPFLTSEAAIDQYIDEWQGEIEKTKEIAPDQTQPTTYDQDMEKLSQLRSWLKEILANNGAFTAHNKAMMLKQCTHLISPSPNSS